MDNKFEKVFSRIACTAKEWLESVQSETFSRVPLYKFCASAYRNYCLDAVSLALDLQYMLGQTLRQAECDTYKKFFDSHQDEETGFFHEPFCEEELGKSHIKRVIEMSGTYLGFQVGGAYRILNRFPEYPFIFYQKMLKPGAITNYLEKMPWISSPWGAGGWVDSVSTMLSMNVERGDTLYRIPLEELLNWVYNNQNREHGFWGEGEVQGDAGLINGGYHILRGTLFNHHREFRYHKTMIDRIILQVTKNKIFKKGHGEGCHDLDAFYLLMRLTRLCPGYRKNDIQKLSRNRLEMIFDFKNKDGAFSFFPCNAHEIHNYYKVSPGNAGESDIQGTVFYLTTIKALSRMAFPDMTIPWNYSITHG